MTIVNHHRNLPCLLWLLLIVCSLALPLQYSPVGGSNTSDQGSVTATTAFGVPSSTGWTASSVKNRIRSRGDSKEPTSAQELAPTITHDTTESPHTRGYLKRAFFCPLGQKFCRKKTPVETTTAHSHAIPTIAELKAKIQKAGVVTAPGTTSLFYTALGNGAVDAAKSWFKSHPDAGNHLKLAYFNNMISPETYGRLFSPSWPMEKKDQVQKLLSQAFAECAIGDVYVCMPADDSTKMATEPPEHPTGPLTAWLGWEYPALTRNARVTAIHRIDPRSNLPSKVLWTRGDPPSVNEPLGTNWPRTETPR